MKKSIIRVFSTILSLCFLLGSLVSCSGDRTIPDGMQLACDEDLEYALYVPRNWTVNQTGHVAGAYVSVMDRSNVSLTSYMPETGMTGEQYWEMCRTSYQKEFTDFQMISTSTTSMAGQTVPLYTYSATVGGESFRFMQAILGASGLFYTFTYTATEENFDKYVEDVLHMIEVFTLK